MTRLCLIQKLIISHKQNTEGMPFSSYKMKSEQKALTLVIFYAAYIKYLKECKKALYLSASVKIQKSEV